MRARILQLHFLSLVEQEENTDADLCLRLRELGVDASIGGARKLAPRPAATADSDEEG